MAVESRQADASWKNAWNAAANLWDMILGPKITLSINKSWRIAMISAISQRFSSGEVEVGAISMAFLWHFSHHQWPPTQWLVPPLAQKPGFWCIFIGLSLALLRLAESSFISKREVVGCHMLSLIIYIYNIYQTNFVSLNQIPSWKEHMNLRNERDISYRLLLKESWLCLLKVESICSQTF